jgi:hypothetical protein
MLARLERIRTVMKQYTTFDQTAKLIELGFEKPAMKNIFAPDGVVNEEWYSIGELIEMLPQTINVFYDLVIMSSHQGWWVLYGMIGDGDMWSIEHEVYRNDLIDALYAMILQLKEKRKI